MADPLGVLDTASAASTTAAVASTNGSSGGSGNSVEWSVLPCWDDMPSPIRAAAPHSDDSSNGNGSATAAAAEAAKPAAAVHFPVDHDINKKIHIWHDGDVVRLSADAVVNSTNETLNERNGTSERIITAAGREILPEIQMLEGCRTGEAKMTGGFLLPARHVVHTVGPRYNIKYKTAAESALHSCYRSSMELVKEAGLASVGFTVINSVRRGYPPEAGAHMALRTIRRFLEKFGSGIDGVVFVLADEIDMRAYQATLPLYFPRTAAEVEYAQRHLPDDIGNEYGEPVQAERKIRIGDIPRPSASFLNESNIGEDNPLASWANPDREAEMPEVPIDKEKLLNMLTEVRGDHDAIRKEEMINKAPKGQEDTIRRYQRWLRRARTEDLNDLANMNILYPSGTDSLGRTVVCVIAKNYNVLRIDRDRMLLHLIDKLDLIANKDYVVVFFNTDSTSENRPDFTFVRDVYNILHPKYRRNLKTLFIVHPTWWVRLSIMIMNTFFTSDIREKIRMVDRLVDLYDIVSVEQLKVPDFVMQHDVTLNGPLITAAPENHDSL